MVNALELFENFKNNQTKRALLEEQLRLSPLREEVLRFGLAKDRAAMDRDDRRLGMLSRQQEATERFNQGRLGLMAQGNMLKAQPKSGDGPKAPSGYRFTADGNMEPIPGGPADLKAEAERKKSAEGNEDINIALGTLRGAYDRLEKGGGITSTKNSSLENIPASLSASGPGQLFGKVIGSQNQSARNEIAMTRPALLAAFMKATGMTSRQMDSNAELKLWLSTATDPTLDVESNRTALNNIERKYLRGAAGAGEQRKALNGKNYIKRNGQWFEE